jgi:hypothetical protein
MIRKRIEVKANGNVKLSLGAFFLSLPWCCITPAALSLLGFLGAAGAAKGLLTEALYPLFIISLFLLGRANYLSFYKKYGSKVSRAVVFASTIGTLALWAFRFGLLPI